MSKANLILHCGGRQVSLGDLKRAPVSVPSDTFVAIPHIDLVEMVKDMLPSGMHIVNEAHALAQEGKRYFGLFQLASADDLWSPVIGIRNAHDYSFAAGGVMGENVTVCDNLCFFGEEAFARRHTLNLLRDLPGLIERMLMRFAGMQKTISDRLVILQNRKIDDLTRDHIIVSAVREGVIPASRLPRLLAEIKNPAHPEHLQYGEKSAWVLYNAFTEILKPSPTHASDAMFALPKRALSLQAILDRTLNLKSKS